METKKQPDEAAAAPAKSMKEKRKQQLVLCRGRAVLNGYNEYHSDLRLQGKWMGDYGFRSGQVVDISLF